VPKNSIDKDDYQHFDSARPKHGCSNPCVICLLRDMSQAWSDSLHDQSSNRYPINIQPISNLIESLLQSSKGNDRTPYACHVRKKFLSASACRESKGELPYRSELLSRLPSRLSLLAERITTAETSQFLRCSAEAPADHLTSCDGDIPYCADPHNPRSIEGQHAHCCPISLH